MNKSKPVLSLGKKIKLLKDRKLIILNPKNLKNNLRNYGYQWFINGYNDPFMKNFDRNKNEYAFNSSSESFNDIFKYDKELRLLFTRHIADVESAFVTKIVDFISEKLVEWDGKILKIDDSTFKSIFSSSFNKEYIFNLLTKYIDENDKLFLKYNIQIKDDYLEIPIWVLCQTWSFGDTIKLFKSLNKELQYKILKTYNNLNVNTIQFIEIMTIIKKIRNISAHNNVLYNIEIKVHGKYFKFILKTDVLEFNLDYNNLHLFNLAEIVDIIKNFSNESIINELSKITKKMIINSKFIPNESKEYILMKIGY
ncbi:MAG: Abi family protein [Ureaplasma sp.]|nr:Abi family protein [Ureaplasma sp.]